MLRSGIRNFLLALALLPAGNPSMAVADSLATSDPVPDAYSVLQRHGLLEAATPVAAKSAPVISLPAPSTRPSRTVAVPTATSLTETDVLPRAYQRLRALGLLKSEPSSKSATALIADTRPKADRVVVDKSERKLFLMRNGQTFREFRISLGKAPEDRSCRKVICAPRKASIHSTGATRKAASTNRYTFPTRTRTIACRH